jgi:hypothetical protein
MTGTQFKLYRRKGVSQGRPYVEDENTDHISISAVDEKNGSPKEGDMIFRNPDNLNDQWLVAKDYFEKNFEPAE